MVGLSFGVVSYTSPPSFWYYYSFLNKINKKCPTNLILTQHTGGGYTNEIKDKVNIFLDNLKRYSNKTSLLNVINPSKGY